MSLESNTKNLLNSTGAKLALALSLAIPGSKAAAQTQSPPTNPNGAMQQIPTDSPQATYEPAQYYPAPYPAYGPIEGAFIEPVCPSAVFFARLGPIGLYGSPLGFGCYWPTYPGFVIEVDRFGHGFFHRNGGPFAPGFHAYGGERGFVHEFDAHHPGYGGGPAFRNVHPPAAVQPHAAPAPHVAPPAHSEPHSNLGNRAPAAHAGSSPPR